MISSVLQILDVGSIKGSKQSRYVLIGWIYDYLGVIGCLYCDVKDIMIVFLNDMRPIMDINQYQL